MTPKKLATNNNQNDYVSNLAEALTKGVLDYIAQNPDMQAILDAADDPCKLVVDMIKDCLYEGANSNG